MEKLAPPQPLATKEQMFYDVPPPAMPEQAFGVESQQILRVSQAVGNLASFAPEPLRPVARYAEKADRYKEELVTMSPLLERVVQQEEISVEDVRPYRSVIKTIARQESFTFRWAERGARFLAFFGIRSPQRKLNDYVERKFVQVVPEKVGQAISFVKQKIDTAMNFADVFMPMPREQAKTHEQQPETLKDFIVRGVETLPGDMRNGFLAFSSFMTDALALEDTAQQESEDPSSEEKNKRVSRRKKSIDIRLLIARFKEFRMKRKNRSMKNKIAKLTQEVDRSKI